MDKRVNGWKNRATWNVSLWVSNDEGLCREAVEYANHCKRAGKRLTWRGFVTAAGLAGTDTPDGFRYDGFSLDYKALSEMLAEMIS